MKVTINLDRDEDGVWVAECPAIPGCVSQGKTKEDAIVSIRKAIALVCRYGRKRPAVDVPCLSLVKILLIDHPD